MVDFMTLPEVAERLSIDRKTLDRILARGEMTVNRFGPRTVRVSRKEYERFIENTRVPAESKAD